MCAWKTTLPRDAGGVGLKKDGFNVLSADNSADGLVLVREHRPDLVNSDVQMPVMDGFAMLQTLRAAPVILLTSLQ